MSEDSLLLLELKYSFDYVVGYEDSLKRGYLPIAYDHVYRFASMSAQNEMFRNQYRDVIKSQR